MPYGNLRLQKLFNASDIQMISEYIKWKANKAQKVRWKYFSSFSSVAMGNSSVWEWFKHLENMLYIIYLDNEEHCNNLNFMVKHVLCLEQKKIVEFEVLEL